METKLSLNIFVILFHCGVKNVGANVLLHKIFLLFIVRPYYYQARSPSVPSRSSETIKISKEGPPNTPCISTKHTTVYTAVVYIR